MKKIGFIGCGNMGGALAQAAVKSVGGDCVYVADADEKKVASFCEKYGANTMTAKEIAEQCDLFFLGVKPQMLDTLFAEIKMILEKRTDRFVIVSMAAGVNIASLTNRLGSFPFIRIMPNMPASVGKGVILFDTKDVTDEEKDAFKSVMKESGAVDELPEEKIDAASCISGCGPAFVYMFIEALADGGVACGLPRDKAIQYAAKTLIGASETVLQTKEHPEKLKDMVCSPAGSTIEGVKALENGGFRAATMDAVIAAYKRTLELGK